LTIFFVRLPSLLEFYGYCYFYASFLAGPPAEFGEYISYVNGSQFNNKVFLSSTLIPYRC
jgi:hypothetical protein